MQIVLKNKHADYSKIVIARINVARTHLAKVKKSNTDSDFCVTWDPLWPGLDTKGMPLFRGDANWQKLREGNELNCC